MKMRWMVLLGLAAFCFSCAGGNGKAPVKTLEIQGQKVMVVDMHLHTGKWEDIPLPQQAVLAGAFPPPLNAVPGPVVNSVLSSRGIRDQLNAADIQAGVLFAVYAPRSVGTASNELVRDRTAVYPDRLLGMASLKVENWASRSTQELAALERAIRDDKLIGIKLAHPHMHIKLDDSQYYGIYGVAERTNVPVYVHCGNSPGPTTSKDVRSTDVAFLEDAIRRYPKVRFILGHVGYDFIKHDLGQLDTVIRLAKTYSNVWMEASALGSAGSDPTGANLPAIYKRFKAEGLIDRVIYGSDGPQRPGFVKDYLKRTLNAMTKEQYTVTEMEKVLSKNFITCFAPSLLRLGVTFP